MAKRQTRRTISLKGTTYQRLRNFCDREDTSISGYVETLVAKALDAAGEPVPKKLEPRPEKPKAEPENPITSQHFTF